MSNISGKETKPEILVRKFLFGKGFRYRKNVKKMPGTPDIVLPKYNTIVFIHGCFWHGHDKCPKGALPTTNAKFWKQKISRNIARDKSNKEKLLDLGWRVIIIWQCEIKNKNIALKRLNHLVHQIKSPDYFEM